MSGNHRIMVVDDESDLLKIVELYLKRCGFDTETFTDPLEALEYFKATPTSFSLVLTDIRMPRMTGLELAMEILKVNPNMKVMLMTAYQIDSLEFQTGLPMIRHEDILKKPFLFEQICGTMRKVLQVRK
jgi:DNA-binding NtrC family response regulator